MIVSVAGQLGILGFFKYFNFFADSAAVLLNFNFIFNVNFFLSPSVLGRRFTRGACGLLPERNCVGAARVRQTDR